MADNLPNANDAGASGASSQQPQNQPSGPSADANQQQPTLTFDSFDEDQKKYLAGQGITKQEELTQEALLKVVNHARSSQQTLAERQAELDRLRNGGVANPTGPTGAPSDGASGSQSSTQQPEQKGLDPTTAFTLAGTLTQQYPKLSSKLADGSFYKEMADEGYHVANADGSVNLGAIQKYAARATKEIEIAEKEADLNKPNEIPDAGGSNQQSFDANTAMNLTAARNIALYDKANPRFAEAQKFIADNAK